MLTPTGNLQDWIDNQNRQIRSESDVKIEVFSHTNGVCSLKTTLTKKDLKTFNISESGSILGFENPSVEISFSILKDGKTEYLIDNNDFIRISYGYVINGSWSWAEKGVYEISKTKIPNNGIVAEFEANFLRYQALEKDWIYGGTGMIIALDNNPQNQKTWANDVIIATLKSMDSYLNVNWQLYVPNTAPNYSKSGVGSISERSILSLITNISQAIGLSYKIAGYIDENFNYGIVIKKVDTILANIYNTYYTLEKLNQFNKYEIVDENYYDGIDIVETLGAPDIVSSAVSTARVNIGVEQINSYFENCYIENKYPYDIEHGIISKAGGSGSAGDGQVYTYGNGAIIDYPNSTIQNPTELFFYFPYLHVSKITHSDNGVAKMSLDNPFVCAIQSAYDMQFDHRTYNAISSFLNDWKGYQTHIELDIRFDPIIELYDCVLYQNNRYGVVEQYSMSYNGGFKGKIVFRDMSLINEPTVALTFLENTTFYITRDNTTNQDFSISVNGGAWRTYTAKQSDYETINVNNGDEIRIKGNEAPLYHSFVHCGRCRLSGNIMSLLGNATEIPMSNAFGGFLVNANVVGIDTIYFLNATVLKWTCYQNLFKSGAFEEEIKFIIPAKILPSSILYGCFSINRQKVILDLTEATNFNANCLNTLGYDTDIYYGNEITSMSSGYVSCASGGIVNYYFTKYNRDDVPQFNVGNAIIHSSNKSNTINNVYTDNYSIASACIIQASNTTTVNLYHNDKSAWNVLETPIVSFNSDGSATFSEVANAERYEVVERNVPSVNVLGVVSTTFNPKDLTLSDNKEYFAYLRSINDSDKSIISSKLSQQVNFWRVDSTKSYWYSAQVPPTVSLNGNVLTITPNSSESKFVIYISGGTPVWFETTETTIDLSTIPNVSAGSHTVYVRGYYDTLLIATYGTVSQSTSVSWTKS